MWHDARGHLGWQTGAKPSWTATKPCKTFEFWVGAVIILHVESFSVLFLSAVHCLLCAHTVSVQWAARVEQQCTHQTAPLRPQTLSTPMIGCCAPWRDFLLAPTTRKYRGPKNKTANAPGIVRRSYLIIYLIISRRGAGFEGHRLSNVSAGGPSRARPTH